MTTIYLYSMDYRIILIHSYLIMPCFYVNMYTYSNNSQGIVNITTQILPNDTRVVELTDNQISFIPSKYFKNLPHLNKIDLQRNDIGVIEDNAFMDVSGVLTLFLDENELTEITLLMFFGLSKLKRLTLR